MRWLILNPPPEVSGSATTRIIQAMKLNSSQGVSYGVRLQFYNHDNWVEIDL